jgi:hypothetical protein
VRRSRGSRLIGFVLVRSDAQRLRMCEIVRRKALAAFGSVSLEGPTACAGARLAP